jgi:hypothetical protein
MIDLLNKCEPQHRVVTHCVPTRIIRVLQTDGSATTFRVEQLVEHGGFGTVNPRGAWTTLSTHTDAREGAAYAVALDAAWKLQVKLIAKLKKKIAERAQFLRPA